MNIKKQTDASQYGRSMIEMLGVLAIIGVLSVGGISGYTQAMRKIKTNKTIETMLTISANIKSISLRMRDYTGIKKAAIKMKAIPPELLGSGDDIDTNGVKKLYNAFGGEIAIDKFGTRSFYVAMNGLPRDVCIDIATKDYGSALIYAGNTAFSESTNVGVSKEDNLNFENAGCGTNYCLKQIMTPVIAANACTCENSNTCSVALITY